MAENTRRMNNEPVFGSLAYDLNTLNWGEFDGNAVRQPQEQPQEPLRRPERRERPRQEPRRRPAARPREHASPVMLAGVAVLLMAFRLIAEAPCMSDGSRVEAVRVLARACGADGMVAGQVLDTLYGIQTEEQLKAMYRLKTGVMISGAVELGCVAADMPADMRAQAVEFADRLGLAFQIRDDMLDVVGDEQVFGKPIGSDKEEGKITYVDVDGLEGCARAVEACTRKAKDAVAQWPDHDFLFALADQLVDRNK